MSQSTQAELERQIDVLKEELNSLRKTLGRRGTDAFADAAEEAGNLYEHFRDRAPAYVDDLRAGARHLERSARENPWIAGAVAVGVLVLIGALSRRR